MTGAGRTEIGYLSLDDNARKPVLQRRFDELGDLRNRIDALRCSADHRGTRLHCPELMAMPAILATSRGMAWRGTRVS